MSGRSDDSDSPVLLSIIVPTRNRGRYAASMIESILRLEEEDFELVISDNSEEDLLANWVDRLPRDRRLIYRPVPGLLSMTENHNRAFAIATGEFVCLIGDDDTVLPNIFDACRYARRHQLDAFTPDTPVRYCWPDMTHRYWGSRQAGNLYVDSWKGNLWEGNPQREAQKCMRRAGQGTGWLPKLYHGIVRRSLLEALRMETGAYCFSVSPDVYMGVALARKVTRQTCTDTPFTIPGSSGNSNSGRAAMRQHIGNLKSDPHMVRFKGEVWPDGVPEFFSVETVWAQAALEAVTRLKWEEMLSAFDFSYLYALCFSRHPGYREEIRKAISIHAKAAGNSVTSLWFSAWMHSIKYFGAKSVYYIKRLARPTPGGYSREYGPYPDVRSAAEFAYTLISKETPPWIGELSTTK
jgi:glycosyltransferase involved in cell wall biosynthesis